MLLRPLLKVIHWLLAASMLLKAVMAAMPLAAPVSTSGVVGATIRVTDDANDDQKPAVAYSPQTGQTLIGWRSLEYDAARQRNQWDGHAHRIGRPRCLEHINITPTGQRLGRAAICLPR